MTVRLRVVTWNVRSLRDDAGAVAATLRDLEPDVVCLQEAPRFLRWRSRCAELARESQLVMVGGGRNSGANVILSGLRAQVASVVDSHLSGSPKRHRRGVALAVLDLGGARILVAGTHLSLDAAERERQAREAVGRVAALGVEHAVLCGDFNDVPGSPTWRALSQTLRDAHAVAPVGDVLTFPAVAPARRIDGVFVSPSVRVLGAGVPVDLPNAAAASDHLPVVADLAVPV
ncbi:MAG: endonuclease/exonuclease/phosphatase family protein [Sporichthyaceae bacterium]